VRARQTPRRKRSYRSLLTGRPERWVTRRPDPLSMAYSFLRKRDSPRLASRLNDEHVLVLNH
jgi:hypothetical protein